MRTKALSHRHGGVIDIMKIGIICGSHREDSQSDKIGRFCARHLEEQGLADSTWVLSLAGNPLPLWDENLWGGAPQQHKALDEIRAALAGCDGFIVVAPEWHGMVPAGLKNFFLLSTGGTELAHKPALIIAVSGGAGGAYPVAELRMSSYKNCRICYLPEHLIVRNAGRVFNTDPGDNDPEAHSYLEARLTYCLAMLREYAIAFRGIRASGKTSLETYKNGM